VDIYIPIEEFTHGLISGSDIKIDIKSNYITAYIGIEKILDDSFFETVIPSECNWQVYIYNYVNIRMYLFVCICIYT
jgi:hypothetical protein